jgi:ADP-ribose pyrophosphatase YjhB (NUDIX family)
MSFHKNDRKIQPKKGKSFPGEIAHSNELFNQAIASALKEEFGGGPSAVKTVARLTDANERAVRNWFEGANGPSGRSLVRLIRQSDLVLKAVLTMAGRQDRMVMVVLAGLRIQLLEAITAIDGLQGPEP